MQSRADLLRERFASRFGRRPSGERIFRAPGRVNLIGEHTDYNDGYVMPLAINVDTWVLIEPRSDRQLLIESVDLGEVHSHQMGASPTAPGAAGHWSSYVAGVAESLCDAGYPIRGANLIIHSTVPMGSGLSSSAALEVAVAMALLSTHEGVGPSSAELALICQKAENRYVGALCGVMDQYVSVHGVAGHAVRLDCRSLAHELVPISSGHSAFRVVICNSMVRHQLAGGEYNIRRRECESAVAAISSVYPHVKALRDVSIEMLESLKADLGLKIFRRALHVVSENGRVLETQSALQQGDFLNVARTLEASHASLRDDYAVSCAELDLLVSLATKADGVMGARMTGGGFGGCTINLVSPEATERFIQEVSYGYQAVTGIEPQIYLCEAVDGAGELHV